MGFLGKFIRMSTWKKISSFLPTQKQAELLEILKQKEIMQNLKDMRFGLIDYLEHFQIKLTPSQFLQIAPPMNVP